MTMRPTRNKIIVTTAVTALVLGGAGVAYAATDDGDGQATGPGADRARAAALSLLEGGTANSVERDSENGATWEVEVTKADGSTVDVRLDADFALVVIEGDGEESEGG